MSNAPEYATEAATAILDALEASHLGSEIFNAGMPAPAGVHPLVSSIVLAIGSPKVEVVTIAGSIGTAPQEVSGVVIAGDIIVRFSAQTDDAYGLARDFKVEARSLRDVVAVSIKSTNLFAIDTPEWPGHPEIGLTFTDGEAVQLPPSSRGSRHEREMLARFVERVPSLLGRRGRTGSDL